MDLSGANVPTQRLSSHAVALPMQVAFRFSEHDPLSSPPEEIAIVTVALPSAIVKAAVDRVFQQLAYHSCSPQGLVRLEELFRAAIPLFASLRSAPLRAGRAEGRDGEGCLHQAESPKKRAIENLHPKTIVQSFQLLSLSFCRFSGVPTATFMPSRILRHSSLPGNGCAQPSIQARRRRVGRATVARLGVIPRNLDPAPYQAREPLTRPGLVRGRTSWRGAGDCATLYYLGRLGLAPRLPS